MANFDPLHKNKNAGDILIEAGKVFKQRSSVYGANYHHWGVIMATLFPKGLMLKTPADFGRFGIFVQLFSKFTRYAENFTAGGHEDTSIDTSVYSAMQLELDNMFREMQSKKRKKK